MNVWAMRESCFAVGSDVLFELPNEEYDTIIGHSETYQAQLNVMSAELHTHRDNFYCANGLSQHQDVPVWVTLI